MLTTELAEGVRFAEAETWTQDQRDLAGEAIFRFVFRSFYRLHLFNGDPHPGNYLFRPDGRGDFLDFGLVKEFTPADIAVIRRLIETIVLDPDPVVFRIAMERRRIPPTGRARAATKRSPSTSVTSMPHARAWRTSDHAASSPTRSCAVSST